MRSPGWFHPRQGRESVRFLRLLDPWGLPVCEGPKHAWTPEEGERASSRAFGTRRSGFNRTRIRQCRGCCLRQQQRLIAIPLPASGSSLLYTSAAHPRNSRVLCSLWCLRNLFETTSSSKTLVTNFEGRRAKRSSEYPGDRCSCGFVLPSWFAHHSHHRGMPVIASAMPRKSGRGGVQVQQPLYVGRRTRLLGNFISPNMPMCTPHPTATTEKGCLPTTPGSL